MDEKYLEKYLSKYDCLKGKKSKEEKIRNYNLINLERKNIECNMTTVNENAKNNMLVWLYSAFTLIVTIANLSMQIFQQNRFATIIVFIILILLVYGMLISRKDLKNLDKEIAEKREKRENEYCRIKELSILECVYKDLLLEEDRFVIK
ncbi:Uncharacterised protein [Clostridioides difficile]|uniref:hypothetical protein n=1 Tax=Clostridioides difficile TaxID=1496 RepID=UPI00097FD9FC|nr:hypothetical protein [Clostridioides difficile]SJS16293.1 Uncharacterised protein [Clostridioides difficile]HBG8471014.1 hypothetical protein [Clostridioides difficile]